MRQVRPLQAAANECRAVKLYALEPCVVEIDAGERNAIEEQIAQRLDSSAATSLPLRAIDDLPRLIDRIDAALFRGVDVGGLALATPGPELVSAEDERADRSPAFTAWRPPLIADFCVIPMRRNESSKFSFTSADTSRLHNETVAKPHVVHISTLPTRNRPMPRS